jgi:hypothetical protein
MCLFSPCQRDETKQTPRATPLHQRAGASFVTACLGGFASRRTKAKGERKQEEKSRNVSPIKGERDWCASLNAVSRKRAEKQEKKENTTQ